MPFKKEFSDKLEPIREIGFLLTEFKESLTYSEIKITNKGGVYIARIGFQPMSERNREEITTRITAHMEKIKWEKE